MNIQESNKIDPLKKQTDHGVAKPPLSPMDPPDAFAPPSLDQTSSMVMHPFLKKLVDEHALFLTELGIFEESILSIKRTGFTRELDTALKHFFHFFDREFVLHSRREETALFPLLRERMLAEGEHSPGVRPQFQVGVANGGPPPRAASEHGGGNSRQDPPETEWVHQREKCTTPIDIMNDDHLRAAQLAAVIINFRELAFRLADEKSKLIVLDAALEQGKNLIELIRLHIFREDHIVFPLAHRLISKGEFDEIKPKDK